MQRLILTMGVLVALCSLASCILQPVPQKKSGSEGFTDSKTDSENDPKTPDRKPEPSPAKELPTLYVEEFQTFTDGLLSYKAEDVNNDGCIVGLSTFGTPTLTTLLFWSVPRDYKTFIPTDERYEIESVPSPSISDHNLVAFTASRKDRGTLQAFLWNVQDQQVYQIPSPLPIDFPETEVWDIGNETVVGAIRKGRDVKGCTWTLSPQGPTPKLLPEPDHTIARCISPNGKHIARWKHREEVEPIAISDTGIIRKESDVPGITLSAGNAAGVGVGVTYDHQACVVRETPHLIDPLKGKKGCVTAINDFGRIVGWYESDDPASRPIAFTAVLP